MTEEVIQRAKLPFHKAIIYLIEDSCGSGTELGIVGKLLKATEISEGHDEILAALEKKWAGVNKNYWAPEIAEVTACILEEKRKAELPSEYLSRGL